MAFADETALKNREREKSMSKSNVFHIFSSPTLPTNILYVYYSATKHFTFLIFI